MLLYVILLLTTWPQVKTELQVTPIPSIEDLGKEVLPEQNAERRAARAFGPIVIPDYQFEVSHPNASTDYEHYSSATNTKSENVLENDPLYSSEARILLNLPSLSANRRSYDTDSQYNEFELLKVNNDTPAVANYQESYEDGYSVHEESEPELKKPVRHKTRVMNYNSENYQNNRYNENQAHSQKYALQVRPQTSQGESYQIKNENVQSHFRPVVVVDPATYNVDLSQLNSGTVTSKLASVTPVSTTQILNPTTARYEYHNVKTDGSTSRHYERSQESRDFSYETADNSEVNDRQRKLQKNRRRPYSESSRKLPKEHRDESYDSGETRKRPGYQRYKSRYRPKKRPNWNDEERYIDEDDSREHRSSKKHNSNQQNWSPVDSNSENNGNSYDLNQIEKPKLVPVVPLNILPVGHFDHASALGGSQGFDVSNVMFNGLLPGTTIVSTSAPLISSAQPLLKSGTSSKTSGSIGIITSAPDIVVGQQSISNPVQTFFIPQTKSQNGKTHLVTHSATPIYAVSTTAAPILQGNGVKPVFAASTVSPVQQYAVNQLLVPQSTLNALTFNQGSNYQGQKPLNANLVQLITPKTKGFSQGSSIIPTFLQSSSSQVQNPYSTILVPKTKDQSALITKAANEAFETSMRQLQAQIQKSQNTRFPDNFQNTDAIASTSNTNENVINLIQGTNGIPEKAQLPNMGTKNVEIFNPNLKQNQIGMTFSSPAGLVGQYPTAVLTTPLPLLSTSNFATVRPIYTTSGDGIGVNGYLDTLTELGSRVIPGSSQNMYNPINFSPNYGVLKNQYQLNDKETQAPDLLPQGLSLVSSLPGGNFFRTNPVAQRELISKPKVSSDFERYAEEMLKESFRTIHDTQKWNRDKFPYNINLTDDSPIARLKNELLRMKNSPRGRDRDVIESHQTENKYVIEPRPDKSKHRAPDFSMGKLEELLMNDFKLHTPASSEDIHIYHHHSPKPGRGRKEKHGREHKTRDIRHELHDFLTPPRVKTFINKNHFHEKPLKKRPGRHREGSRSKSRHAKNPDVSASGSHEHGVAFENIRPRSYQPSEYRNRPPLEFYPVLTTSYPEFETSNYSLDHKTKDTFNINHPMTQNILGLLMKNQKLPLGPATNYVRNDDDQNKLYEQGNRREFSSNFQPEKKGETRQVPVTMNLSKLNSNKT